MKQSIPAIAGLNIYTAHSPLKFLSKNELSLIFVVNHYANNMHFLKNQWLVELTLILTFHFHISGLILLAHQVYTKRVTIDKVPENNM
jgi:hypothetical protein